MSVVSVGLVSAFSESSGCPESSASGSGVGTGTRDGSAGRIVSSTGLPAVPASAGHGPCTGSTGRPSTSRISSPASTATPGAASGDLARGSDDSPGSTRSTSQRPSGARETSAPSSAAAAPRAEVRAVNTVVFMT